MDETSITMVNHSLTDSSALSAQQYNGTGSYNDSQYEYDIDPDPDLIAIEYYRRIFFILIFVVSSFGILGNGMVIWLLGFRIKRNNFTTYILNLAVADFGFLTTSIFIIIMTFLPLNLLLFSDILHTIITLQLLIVFFQFSASQYLLTVISIDRCVSVFFPIWHRCHRPTKLSPIVCVLIWVISYLPHAIWLIHFDAWDLYYVSQLQLIVNGLLCLPSMIISSLMIFIKVCCKSRQRRRRKLLITILVTVTFFCFLSLPWNIINMLDLFLYGNLISYFAAMFCACLSRSVNPLIYYLVGRPRKGRSNKSMKAILQKLFKEEEV